MTSFYLKSMLFSECCDLSQAMPRCYQEPLIGNGQDKGCYYRLVRFDVSLKHKEDRYKMPHEEAYYVVVALS